MIKENNILSFFDNRINVIHIFSSQIDNNALRLDATHYEGLKQYSLHENIKFKPLKDFCINIFEPKLFTRIYSEKEYGIPYISSSEMLFTNPLSEKRFISKEYTKNLNDYVIKKGQILISAAGTVGKVLYAPNYLDGVAGTSDILRLNFSDSHYPGYIYTYLNSPKGQSEISNIAYGAIIKRIRAIQLEDLLIPDIQEEFKSKINKLLFDYLDLIEESYCHLKKSSELILSYNNLLDNVLNDLNYNETIDTRDISINDVQYDYRLDAHFYNPIAESLINHIESKSKDYIKLSQITTKLFYLNRFSRTFVEKDFGIPYLAGKDIIKIKPDSLNYLSESETKGLDAYKLRKGWILVTCSGTIGRSCIVWNNFEDYVGTHDLIRIELKNNYDFGYIYAFLNTEYGKNQIFKFKHGAVIDHITPEQIGEIKIPIVNFEKQKEIGDLVRLAYEKRAEALKLEDEAQELLKEALTNN